MLDPDQVATDAETREHINALAALVAYYYDTLRDLHLPESLCVAVVTDWHQTVIADGVTWESDE